MKGCCDLFICDTVLEIRASYRPPWIKALCILVPREDRDFDRERRAWLVAVEHLQGVRDLAENYFEEVVVRYVYNRARPRGAQAAQPRGRGRLASAFDRLAGRPDPYAALYVNEGAPPEVVNAAWLALCKLHHPDRGGDPKTMQQINAAHDEIERRLHP